MSKDKQLVCKDCGEEFTFTAGEQEFFAARGLEAPRRCKRCRRIKKEQQERGYND